MATLTYITVTGTYLSADGVTPKTGYIEFRPTVPLSLSGTGVIIAQPLQAVLDDTGSFIIELLATDNADIAPIGWLWFVDEKIKDGTTWYLRCHSVVGGGLDPLNISNTFYPPGAAVSPPAVIEPGPAGVKGDKGDPGEPGSINGTSNHSALSNLTADDHTQYYNQSRGDARYSQTSHTHTAAAVGALDQTTANGLYVGLTGNQIVAGVKTFSSHPVLSGNPTTALQVVPKQYVDLQDGYYGSAINVTVPNNTVVNPVWTTGLSRGITQASGTFTVSKAGVYVITITGTYSTIAAAGVRMLIDINYGGVIHRASVVPADNYTINTVALGLSGDLTFNCALFQLTGSSSIFSGLCTVVKVSDV